MIDTISQISLPSKLGDPYLKLQLNQEITALFPMTYIEEVFVTSLEKITPIPNQEDYILGLLNHRSQIFWVLDLLSFFKLTSLDSQTDQLQIVIGRFESQVFAFGLTQIEGVMRFTPDVIKSSLGVVSENLAQYVQGCIAQDHQFLPILDPETIFRSSEV
jgi:positive phototaxis protein PixI